MLLDAFWLEPLASMKQRIEDVIAANGMQKAW